jgi:plasmid replication initiation protein
MIASRFSVLIGTDRENPQMAAKEKVLELKKHVAAIHSSNKLSLVQRKIANALLFNAYDELLIKEEYEIHIRTLCNLIGYDSNDYKTIKKALVNLLSTVIEWNLVDGSKVDAEGVWNASSIIADASIDGAVCTYSYSNKMKKLLYCPELYGRLNMVVQAKFQSSYGLALYENCIRYQNIEQTPWFDIAQFRKLMGVEEGKYTIFRDFKKRVLDKAIEEVNKYSPLHVSTKFQKQGRQVLSIQFVIKHAKEEPMDADCYIDSVPLSQQLKDRFAFSKGQIDDTLSSYDEKYILEKIAIVESSASYGAGKINNVAKYLLSALQDDYQPVKSSKEARRSDKSATMKLEKLSKPDDSRQADYRRFQDRQIIEIFNKLTAAQKRKISKAFEDSLGVSLYKDIYERDGLSNVLILDQLCEFIKSHQPGLLRAIPSYSEYCGDIQMTGSQEVLPVT